MLLDFAQIVSRFLDSHFARNVRRNRLGRPCGYRSIESLEPRTLLTSPLVSEVLNGTAGTAIVGTVYDDTDGNGVKNNGENGVAGFVVYLDLDNSGTLNTDAVGTPEPSAVTNVDGDYTINHLVPGNYRVSEVVPGGWTPTAPVSLDVNVRNDKETQADFFNFSGGDVVGTVWNDLNGDGIRAKDPGTGEFTDPGLINWTVFLDLNKDHVANPGEPVTLTDENGVYSFANIPADDYEVTEVLPAGWDVSEGFDIRQTATVVARQQVVQDFANLSLVNGSLEGVIWSDLNVDGVRATDPETGLFTEPGLVDWTVFLDLNGNHIADSGEPTTLTNENGKYSFISLAAGDYEVTEVLPAGWNVAPTFDTAQTVTVNSGAATKAADFANFTVLNGSIRGTIWNDLNRDGIRNVDLSGAFTDPGLVNWTVFLDRNENGTADVGEPITMTDVSGGYSFMDLQVGDYEVQEILPTGWETSVTFDANQKVTVYSGTESIARDFANFNLSTAVPGTVSGAVFNDLNGNGVRDTEPGTGLFTDPGLANWVIFVDQNSNGMLDGLEPSTTTGPDGTYSISGVLPGTVTIIEVSQSGWRPTAPNSGSRTIALKNAGNVSGLDFGNLALQEAVIRGTVFADSNQDGSRNSGENGLAGITVYLDTNNNGTLDADEPRTTTSSDLFFTPAVNETGNYSFTHLASGTYTVRTIVPATLSATPAAQLTHSVTLATAEDRSGVDTAAVFRPNEIHGLKFDDTNGNHQRDEGEPAVAGATIYVDLNRNNSLDSDEPTTVTLTDGTYQFANLTPGAYVVREVLEPGFTATYPATTGGILWPAGTSNLSVGNVTPTSITTSLAAGEIHQETVSIKLPDTGALTNMVDVFLLFDDTGSFVNNSPIVRAAFPDIIAQLQAALPGIDLGFGVGRFEEYANYAFEYAEGRPFILNQPIVAASTPGYLAAIQAALDRTTPGYGGDTPETDIEALYQLVTGQGFDGNSNGSVLDSGAAGLASTQLNPGASGDVPPFSSFQPDPANSVLPAAGNVGGGGFRAGALPIILTATDTGFAFQPKGETSITGVGGLTLPISALTETSRPDTPFNSGAGIQQTITALDALGALVIGLGTNSESNLDPRQDLESLSKLTGAVNHSTTTIANGTASPIAPGDPLYFQIASGFAGSVADGVVNAIQNAATNVAVDITVQASDPRVKIINHTGTKSGIGSGQTATFDIEFMGDGVPYRFDLQFVRAGTNVILGSIPVVIGTPIPGDGYEFEDLPEGEIHQSVDFGSHFGAILNQPPVAADGTLTATEDSMASGTLVATDADSMSLTYSVAANASHGTVHITDPATGAYTYTPEANYSGPDSFTFKANDGSLDSNTATITVNVAAVNDAPGIISSNSASVMENSTSVLTVTATDIDLPAQSISYSISGGEDSTLFAIDPNTGLLSFLVAPDFEAPGDLHGANQYHLTVKATDNGTSPLFVTQDIVVTVIAVNDNPPVFTSPSPTFDLPENSIVGTVVGTVSATDADRPTQALSYTLISGNESGAFALNSGTGEITVANSTLLNFEGTKTFTLGVRATDSGTPVAMTADAVVVVNLANVLEGPVITIPTLTGTYRLKSSPLPISPDATFAYEDLASPNYTGAKITVSIVAGQSKSDAISILAKGDLAGKITVKGSKVYSNAIQIGTFTGGSGKHPNLVVTLNGNATTTSVQNLLRRFTFTAKTGVGLTRTLQLQVTNIAGQNSNPATRAIAVLKK